jgi:peptidoglycan DL-endopeptidase CwlO
VRKEIRFVLTLIATFALGVSVARATQEQDESLVDRFKKLFSHPTPTPTPRKKKRSTSSPAAAKTPASSPGETAAALESSPGPSPSASTAETPSPSVTTETPAATGRSATQYFDAVRPITPHASAPRSSIRRAAPATLPTITAVPEIPSETPAARPMPSLPIFVPPSESQSETPQPSPSETPQPSRSKTPSASPTSTPTPQKTPTTAPAFSMDALTDSANSPAGVRNVLDLALQLTTRRLSYKYVSADPKNGGLDSSGFVCYVLTQAGVKNVPRDAREQYIWLRKAGTFQTVLAQRDDTFELDELKPGDLLFWASNYGMTRDPEITQTMIYLGRDKSTNERLMIGASENGVFKNQRRSGVSVFDFKIGRSENKSKTEENPPVFVGYGHVPGLTQK